MMNGTNRRCGECGKFLKGRVDQKFCNSICRNAYHNRRNSFYNNLIRSINLILRNNRKILEDLLPKGRSTAIVSRNELIIRGYDFRYHTHRQTNRQGNTYCFCYELGILPIDPGKVRILRNTDKKNTTARKEIR